MRYLGLDVGDRNIGVALSDETATIASGLVTLPRVGPRRDLKVIAELARAHGADEVVVGLPRHPEGAPGARAQKVLDFVEDLRPMVGVPVVPWDERLKTVVAHKGGVAPRRPRKTAADKVAAILTLQSYLDYRKLAHAEGVRPDA
jgi:putative Holliday junction resolvase